MTKPRTFKAVLQGGWGQRLRDPITDAGRVFSIRIEDAVSRTTVAEITIPSTAMLDLLSNTHSSVESTVELWPGDQIGKEYQHHTLNVPLDYGVMMGKEALAAAWDAIRPQIEMLGWRVSERDIGEWNFHRWDQATKTYRLMVYRYVKPGTALIPPEWTYTPPPRPEPGPNEPIVRRKVDAEGKPLNPAKERAQIAAHTKATIERAQRAPALPKRAK